MLLNLISKEENHYYVLRLNHRIERDKRLTTHIALIARAFGCKGFIYTGEEDFKLEQSIKKLHSAWSQNTEYLISYWDDWIKNLKVILNTKTILVHLTMYGTKIQLLQEEINKMYISGYNVIFVVGGAKVPDIVYKLSKYNVSVTNQPHSEAGALAVALDRIFPDSIDTNL